MSKRIEVKRGSITVPIYRTKQVKHGKTYHSHTIVERYGGKRRLHYAASLHEAKAKALEIALAIDQAKPEVLLWEDDLRVEIRKAIQALKPSGVTLLPASQLFAEAVKILGSHDQLLAACQHWTQNRPDKPLTPKPTKEAASAYQAGQEKLTSRKRQRNVANALNKLISQFGCLPLHEIDAGELKNFTLRQNWNAKTRNEFLGVVGLLFKEGQIQGWVPEGFNPAKVVGRFEESRSAIGTFEPWELKQMLSRLTIKAPELVPLLAIWCFAGIRLYEISRITWPEVNRGLHTGYIELEAAKTKTGEPRVVPVSENLKTWLTLYGKDNGTILPAKWLEATKSADNRLAELPRTIARKTGVKWRDNAPRHSYATYHFRLHKDAGETVRAMGTSLAKFERHYWNKSKCVTDETAREWFNILPSTVTELLTLPDAATA